MELDDQANLVQLARKSGISDEAIAESILGPAAAAVIRLLPAGVAVAAFEAAAAKARAKLKATN